MHYTYPANYCRDSTDLNLPNYVTINYSLHYTKRTWSASLTLFRASTVWNVIDKNTESNLVNNSC